MSDIIHNDKERIEALEDKIVELESALQSAREETKRLGEEIVIRNGAIDVLKSENARVVQTIKAMEKQGAAIPQLTCNQEAYRRMFGYPSPTEPRNITVMERDKNGHVEVVCNFPPTEQERKTCLWEQVDSGIGKDAPWIKYKARCCSNIFFSLEECYKYCPICGKPIVTEKE